MTLNNVQSPFSSPLSAWRPSLLQLAFGPLAAGLSSGSLVWAAQGEVWLACAVGVIAGLSAWIGSQFLKEPPSITKAPESLAGALGSNVASPENDRRLTAVGMPVQGFSTFVLAALDAAPMPVVIIDSGWRLRAANLAAQRRFSLSRPGVRADQQIRRPELIDAVTQVLATGEARSLSFETAVPIEQHETATIAPFDADGARYVLLTVIDGTEARRSERMRADFLANASHELRTPLASITGCIETLQGPARDDPASHARFLTIMHEQAQRMGRLIADLLSLSRIEINEHVRPTSQFDLVDGVREAVDAIARSPRAAGASIIWDHQQNQDPIMVGGDWDQVQQLITNLIDNALKYGPKGGQVRISLRGGLARADAVVAAGRVWDDAARLPLTSPEPEPGRLYAVLRVEDDGPGIDPQLLPRLAERFFRVENTAHLVPGTGLGLAIVKHILSRHRGGVIVETRQGQGTAFGVYLPQP